MASMPSVVFDVAQLDAVRISLRPGDVLVVKCQHPMRAADMDRLRDRIEPVLPHGCTCLMMPAGFDLAVIEKADTPRAPARQHIPSWYNEDGMVTTILDSGMMAAPVVTIEPDATVERKGGGG